MPPTRPTVVPSKSKELIRLDSHKLRSKALRDYQKAERDLDNLKGQLKRYHEHDVPGFRAWLHTTFGHLMTRHRELLLAMHEKQDLLMEIEQLAMKLNLSEAEAYRKAIWRRAHPEEAEKEDLELLEADRKRFKDIPPEELEEIANGDNDHIPDDDWEVFQDFFESMTGIRPPPRHQPPPRQEKSIKELYRTIVRRLHPDHHGQMSEARKNLWHEAQDAYRRHDEAALYSILTRCENGEAGLGDHSPLSLIRNLTKQLKQACQSNRRDIRRMKGDVAWDFENRIRNPRYVRDIQRDLEDAISATAHELKMTSETLDYLERQANRPERQSRKPKSRRNRDIPPDFLDDLPFF